MLGQRAKDKRAGAAYIRRVDNTLRQIVAFARIAAQFHTTTSAVSWSLSTYFIGFAFGQLLYGPLLDRFGRKRPIYVGLTLYLIASALCIHPGSLPVLIALRFLLRALLAITGHVQVDPDMAHGEDGEVDHESDEPALSGGE